MEYSEEFELMSDTSKEDAVVAERRRSRENEIAKKLGEYLLKGYCMLSDVCQACNCILLRTPEHQLFCVACHEIDIENKTTKNEQTARSDKKKDNVKRSKNNKNRNLSNCNRIENKLQWAVNEVTKTHNPNRINEMCTVIIRLTETIKALKQYEMISREN